MRRPSRTTAALVLAVATVVPLAGCSGTPEAGAAGSAVVDEFVGRDAREVIDELEAVPAVDRRADLFASVRASELLITDTASGTEISLPIPEGLFYYSFAPYVEQTHPCAFHSLTTCPGELSNTDVQVLVTTDDGETIVDEIMTTSDAGWVGLWLPADIEATITVTHGDLAATSRIATGADDKTCDSTLQLT